MAKTKQLHTPDLQSPEMLCLENDSGVFGVLGLLHRSSLPIGHGSAGASPSTAALPSLSFFNRCFAMAVA